MMRRPGSRTLANRLPDNGGTTARQEASVSAVGAWYGALISILLLIAAGIYIVYLHQQRLQSEETVGQLLIGQDLLRADRDELLQKIHDRENDLEILGRTAAEMTARLARLDVQRNDLQADVVSLTQDLAAAKRAADRAPAITAADKSTDIRELERERDSLKRQTIAYQSEIDDLEAALADKEQALTERSDGIREQQDMAAEAEAQKAALGKEVTRLLQQLAGTRRTGRQSQIIRGHRASFGEVRPYLASVGPGDWQTIEGWLAQQLRRPMAIPDLSEFGWSYEGARLLAAIEGPPMTMLLYADAENRPISLTIAQDRSGEQNMESHRDGGLNLMEWREERHAFVLASEADEVVLRLVAATLQNQPPAMTEDATVPSSRFFRPAFRPETG